MTLTAGSIGQMVEFTETQKRILKILEDGMPHSRKQLIKEALYTDPDNVTDQGNLNNHICLLNKRLRRIGHEVVCELVRMGIHYRHVVLITPSDG